MLDQIKSDQIVPTLPDAEWRSTLAAGDIVAFRFPVSEDDTEAKPKVRPCLVLEIETVCGKRYALLAYGTTSNTAANHGYEVRVSKADAQGNGLRQATRFIGARRILVSLDSSGFAVSSTTGAPILGTLDAAARERMNRVRARIHAERDIAADCRASRRSRRNRLRTPYGFTVEKRFPRRAVSSEGDAQ